MQNFISYIPTKVIFGKDTTPQLSKELAASGIKRVLLHTGGRSVFESGLYDNITRQLGEAGIVWECVSGVLPNPRLSKVREAVATARAMKAEAIVPIGGGSVFDSAKAVAVGAAHSADIWEVMTKKLPVTQALPILGVLTLSGTSSEMNGTFVITNEDTQEKFAMALDIVLPKAVVVDPTLQYTVPLHQIMHCGVDALSHVLEAYFEGLSTSQVIIEHCESYAKGIMRAMRAMPAKQQDYNTRAELCFCSVYAHSGWASVGRSARGDFSTHRISHSVGALYDVPHGVAIGAIMPGWMQYMYDLGKAHDVFARFATHICGVTSAPDGDFAKAGIAALRSFILSVNMPDNLKPLGITEADVPRLAELAARTLPYGCVQPMNLEHITKVLQYALK